MPCAAGMDLQAVAVSGLSGVAGGLDQEVLAAMAEKAALDEAMSRTGRFPAYFTDMLAVGLGTGKAPECLSSLHLYYLRQHRLKKLLERAALQPLAMLLVTACVIGIILAKIFPVFDAAYAAAGMSVGVWTARAVAVGVFLSGHWKAVGACAAIVGWAAALSIFSGAAGKAASGVFSRTKAGRSLEAAKLAQALSMGLDSGMDAQTALEMACETAGSGPRPAACLADSAAGTPLHEALERHGLVNAAQARMILSGMGSGTLPDAAAYVAMELMDEAEDRIRRISGAIEPAVTLIGSALAGGTIILAMLPLLDVVSAIG